MDNYEDLIKARSFRNEQKNYNNKETKITDTLNRLKTLVPDAQ